LKNSNRTGALPDYIGNLTGLVLLDLSNNTITGVVPDRWASLQDLTFLLLNRNPGISGDLPASFKSLESLEVAYLDGTALTGDLRFLCSAMEMKSSYIQKGIVANCGSKRIKNCPCCHCCESQDGTKEGEACSDAMVAGLEKKWDTMYRRTRIFFDDRASS
jgi:hypothetical protein